MVEVMKIKIRYLDGKRFKRSILASVQRVFDFETYLNEINVFPVPDGDTGTNLALTLNSIAAGAQECQQTSFDKVSDAIADSALTGARGNSGVILAQFFQGLAEATRGKVRLTTHSFARAVSDAVEGTRQAISAPREGTIITVMRDWATHLLEHAPKTHDFAELLNESLIRAKASLAETPNKLLVLKKAGVVDAGAAGFVKLLEGLVDFMSFGRIAAYKLKRRSEDKLDPLHLTITAQDIKFRFCTECLLAGDNLELEALKRLLKDKGDSLIVIGSPQKVRIHIHTDHPQEIFGIGAQQGTLIKTKVEDMQLQHEKILNTEKIKNIALVTDSTCDLPLEIYERYSIHVVPVTVQVGEKSYLDRIEISPADFYRLMETKNQKLLTSQPAPAQFKDIYNQLISNHSSVISIHLSGKLSGTVEGARIGRKISSDSTKINVIDGKTSSAALGLLVSETGRLIETGEKLSQIMNRLEQAIKNLRIFVNIPCLKYVMRSGRLSRSKGIIATLLNVKPVITLDAEGAMIEAARVIGKKRGFKKTLDLAIQYARQIKLPKFNIAHANAPELALWYKVQLQRQFKDALIMIAEASPALTLHIGIGGTAIAILGDSIAKP